VQVVDWDHAREHLWALAQLLYGEGTAAAWAWLETVAGELWLAAAPADVDTVALAAAEAWAAPPPEGAPRRTTSRLAGQRVALSVEARARALVVRHGGAVVKRLPPRGPRDAPVPFERFVDLMEQEARAQARRDRRAPAWA
jgi:hypothetical protein